MVIDRQIAGAGTSEKAWLGCAALRELPRVSGADLVPKGSRLVICAPHPDDEILPCAGLLLAAQDSGRAILILALTDGEKSHGPDSALTPDELRRRRPAETAEALRCLGVDAEVVRLRLPDGGLSDSEERLRAAWQAHFRAGDVVLLPWALDGHPDHEAVARTAVEVAGSILETPIWGWHWSAPETTPMPWARGCRLELNPEQQRRKAAAIAAFTTQIQSDEAAPPILSASTLARFTRPWETYFR